MRKAIAECFLSAQNFLIMLFAVSVGHAIQLFIMPILSRLYNPQEFGELGILTAFLSITLYVASWCYEVPIPTQRKRIKALSLLLLSLVLSSFFGFFLLFMIIFLPYFWIPNTESKIFLIYQYRWILPLGIIWGCFYKILNFWNIRECEFRLISRTRVVQKISMVLFQVLAGIFGGGTLGLLGGHIVGEAGGCLSLGRGVLHRPAKAWVVAWKLLPATARAYFRMATQNTVFELLGVIYLAVPVFFIATGFGLRESGYLTFAMPLMFAPSMLCGKALGQVYYGEMSKKLYKEPEYLLSFFHRMLAFPLLFGVFFFGIIAIFGPQIFSFFFGGEWFISGEWARLLAFPCCIALPIQTVSSSHVFLNRIDVKMKWNLIRLLLLLFALWLSIFKYNCSAYTAVAIFSTITAFSKIYFLIRLNGLFKAYLFSKK